jgi:Ion channel
MSTFVALLPTILLIWLPYNVFAPRVGYGDICPGEEMSHAGKFFLVVFVFIGLGMFCGPITSLAATWRLHIPGGLMTLASLTIGVGVMIFTTLEDIDQVEAIYASVITGTYAWISSFLH